MSTVINENIKVEFDVNMQKFNSAMDKMQQKVIQANKKMQKAFETTKKSMKTMAKVAGVLAAAFAKFIKDGVKYTKSLEDARGTISAMIMSQNKFTDSSGKLLDKQSKLIAVNIETEKVFSKIKAILPDTAMQLNDMAASYGLMLPAMNQAKIGLNDQIDLLKLVSNAATNFKMDAQSLNTGIDGLASGVWVANSAFGRMMTSLNITKEGLKNAGDKAKYLKDRLREAGQLSDTMTVAVSNLQEAYDGLASSMIAPYWDQLKERVRKITHYIDESSGATNNMQKVFRKAANAMLEGIKVVTLGVYTFVKAIEAAGKALIAFFAKAHQVYSTTMKWFGDADQAGLKLQESRVATAEQEYAIAKKSGILASKKLQDMRAAHAELRNMKALNFDASKADAEYKHAMASLEKVGESYAGTSQEIITFFDSMKLSTLSVEEATEATKAYIKEQMTSNEAVKKGVKAGNKLAKTAKAVGTAVGDATDKVKEWIKTQTSEAQQAAWQQTKDFWQNLGRTIEYGIGDSLLALVDKTQRWGDVMRNVLNDIARQLMSSGLNQLFGNGTSGAGFNIGGWLQELLGGQKNHLDMFASGGIVNSPTMVGTHGIAGEAGAEAIMPVKRMSNGNLGVQSTEKPITINNYGSNEVQIDQSGDQIEITIGALTQQVRRGTGSFGSVLEKRYGLQKR